MKAIQVKTIGFLGADGKVYKRKANAEKSKQVRQKNRLENRANKKGWKVSSLK